MDHAAATALNLTGEPGPEQTLESLAAAYGDLPVGVALFRQGARAVYANPAFCSLVREAGLEPQALACDTAEELFRLGPKAWEGGAGGAVWARFPGSEKCLAKADGGYAWYRVRLTRASLPGGGPGLLLVADEVSRYRELIDLLLNRHKLYRGFVEMRAEPLCRFLPDLSLLYANASFCKCFGRARRDVLGRNFLSLLRPEDRARFVDTLESVTPAAPMAELEHRLARPGGRPLWIKWTFQGFFYRTGHIKDYQAVGVDISEHKLAEERVYQADRLVSLGTLVSGVAHEINNPNNFIMLNAPLLATVWERVLPVLRRAEAGGAASLGGLDVDQVDADVRRLAKGIAEGASRIGAIVAELKQYARREDEGSHAPVSANEIVASAVVLLGKTIRTRTGRFSVRYGEGLPPVMGLSQRLEQVVLNLIQNACFALTDPSQAIEIETSHDPAQGAVVIAVRDEGAGIRPEDLPRVTDPFFSTRSAAGGTGLGLSISLKILKEHGGRLALSSVSGQGTAAEIILPAAR
jgi:two-component system, NtrC family, sensor histidine kinase HupT/HoxJ